MIFRKAILIIHGFNGSPLDLEYLSNNIELKVNFDVFTFTLPGHNRLKHEDFIKSAREHVELLINYGYTEIYVVGYSMGGVLACYVASKYKEVKKLVLISPAFHYLSVKDDEVDIVQSIKSGLDVIKEHKGSKGIGKFIKLPINAPLEFVHLVKECYDTPKYVRIPTLVIWGTDDKLVPFSSASYVFDSLKTKNKFLLLVKGANHNIFASVKRELASKFVIKFLGGSSI